MKKVLSFVPICCLLGTLLSAQIDYHVIGHSHNDYAHNRPLYDAVDAGMASIEVDIFLIDGVIIVGHDEEDLDMSHDFKSMYLDPIVQIAKKKGDLYGAKSQEQTILLIDLKMGGMAILDELHTMISKQSHLFDRKGISKKWSPIKIVLSGDAVRMKALEGDKYPFFHVDGRCSDIRKKLSSDAMPIISDNYTKYFKWSGSGKIKRREVRKLKRIVRRVHKQGKLLRFWATPDDENLWTHFIDHKVDIINVDDLTKFKKYNSERIHNN